MNERINEPKEGAGNVILQLNPNGVVAPTRRAVAITSQVVGICLRGLEGGDLSPSETQGWFIGYSFNGVDVSEEERRETYRNWLLSKGFQDLARGIRETLEEAALYLAMIRYKPGLTTQERIEAEMAEVRAKAAKLQFPQLLEQVNADLPDPLAFNTEFLSLQKARNCLEHRGGRVGERDLDPATARMTLSFPRLRVSYHHNGQDIELPPGKIIDTHSADNPFGKGEEVQLYISRVTRTRDYSLGEPVVFTASDFCEVAIACGIFANDLGAKLPTSPMAYAGAIDSGSN